MPRTRNDSYKKVRLHRDHRKFVIVAEGEREDDYFGYFNRINRRIAVSIVQRDLGKSACKYFLQRLDEYDNSSGLEPGDLVWFVMDVDKWERDDIEELYQICSKNSNWGIAISNPCFEVWLYFHYGDPSSIKPPTSKKMKQALNTLVPGGYNRMHFVKQIKQATQNAKKSDTNAKYYFPNVLQTKVYNLGAEMLKFIGNTTN